MKKRQCRRLRVGLRFMAAAALMLALPLTQARAQVNCATVTAGSPTDSDRDGFTDYQECNGIDLDLGTAPARHFPTCVGTTLSRDQCLDPNTKDLFVILVPATPSLIPSDPLKFVSAPQSGGGLGIATHMLTPDQAGSDRRVTSASPQPAMRCTENLDPTGNILGISNYGMALDASVVFTKRITNFVNSVYASVGQTPPAGLLDDYTRHTFAHEIGHTIALTATYDSRYGGYHYKSGTIVVMEQAVKYTVKGSKVTFYVSTAFATQDPPEANLLPQ